MYLYVIYVVVILMSSKTGRIVGEWEGWMSDRVEQRFVC